MSELRRSGNQLLLEYPECELLVNVHELSLRRTCLYLVSKKVQKTTDGCIELVMKKRLDLLTMQLVLLLRSRKLQRLFQRF